ncbi:MAG: hypothetical protein Q7U92_11460, partial [Bradyrhizobium sp.]|nr:hypothetical protein [Bradyrhizobium sp.]
RALWAYNVPRKHFDTSGKSPAQLHHPAILGCAWPLPENKNFGDGLSDHRAEAKPVQGAS